MSKEKLNEKMLNPNTVIGEVEDEPTLKHEKKVQVSAAIPESQAKALSDIYFEGKGEYPTKQDVLREAITLYLENRDTLGTVKDS